MNKAGLAISESPVSAASLGELLGLVADDTLSSRIAKDVFDEMFETGATPAGIVEAKGLKQITDTSEIETIIDDIIAGADQQVAQFRSGNEKVMGWFVGQVMKATQGKANPKAVNELLHRKLSS